VEFINIENNKITEISIKYGADIPFVRPKELAEDNAKGIDVVLHAIDWLKENNKQKQYDLIMLLQPTSPLRTTEDIDKAIELLFLKEAKAIVSVCEVEHHPLWANTLPEDRRMKDFIRREVLNKNRQELPICYRLNGAIYIAYCGYLKKQKSFFGENTFAYLMPKSRSVDIDNEIDFIFAELLLRYIHHQTPVW